MRRERVLAAASWLAALAVWGFAAPVREPGAKKAVVIEIDDEITKGLAAHVRRGFREAREADLVVLRVDTFGGRVDAALEIAKAVEGSRAPVIAWVSDKAWSAGALISLSASKIYMHPSASIGSAMPVSSGGGHSEALGEKYVSALRAKFRALAEKNGYPPDLAAAMVDRDIEVVRVRVDGKTSFVDAKSANELKKAALGKAEVETVIAKGKLLNLTAARAIEYGLASRASSIREAVDAAGPAGAEIATIGKTGLEKFVAVLTSTAVTSMLVLFGFMLISGEMHAPGFGWMGVGGACCFLAVYGGHYLIDAAGWIDLFLVLLGLFLVGLEIFVVPGFGLTGVFGIACIFSGLYLMVAPFVVPREPWEFERLKDVLWVMAAAAVGSLAGLVSVVILFFRLPMFRKVSPPAAPSSAEPDAPPSGEIAAGMRGLALTKIDPEGRAQFGVHMIRVRARSGTIPARAELEIVKEGKIPLVRHYQ